MKQQWHKIAVLMLVFLALVMPAQAKLTTIGTADIDGVGTGFNLIYDNDSPFGSIVWLDYTSDYSSWYKQSLWALGLNDPGAITYHLKTGVTIDWSGDWRLPETVDAQSSWGKKPPSSSSEMAHLYYDELGNIGCPDSGCGLNNTGDFQNLVADWYWSETEHSKNGSLYAWHFITKTGEQYSFIKGNDIFALAVRPAQVAVPEPSTFLLVGGGLAGLVFLRRRR